MAANPTAPGEFTVYRRLTFKSTTPLRQAFSLISGHSFRLTPAGTLLYTGKARALESAFSEAYPTRRQVVPLVSSPQHYRFALLGPGNHASRLVVFRECRGKGTWRLLLGKAELERIEESEGFTSGREATHCVLIDLPELVAHMMAMGVDAQDVGKKLMRSKEGTIGLAFRPDAWKEQEGREKGRTAEEEELEGHTHKGSKYWKRGWWITAGEGLGVWVS